MLDIKDVYESLKNKDSESFISFINENKYRYIRISDTSFGSYIAASNSDCQYIDVCCEGFPAHVSGLITDKILTFNKEDFHPSLVVVAHFFPNAIKEGSDVLLTNVATSNRVHIETLLKRNLWPLQAYPFYGGSILFTKIESKMFISFGDSGPGNELRDMLSICGIKAGQNCGCQVYRKVMNMFGCEWCREYIEDITDWLAQEAKKRKLPFFRKGAKALIRLAIYKASFYQTDSRIAG